MFLWGLIESFVCPDFWKCMVLFFHVCTFLLELQDTHQALSFFIYLNINSLYHSVYSSEFFIDIALFHFFFVLALIIFPFNCSLALIFHLFVFLLYFRFVFWMLLSISSNEIFIFVIISLNSKYVFFFSVNSFIKKRNHVYVAGSISHRWLQQYFHSIFSSKNLLLPCQEEMPKALLLNP